MCFGFAEPFEFRSIGELVCYYAKHSLKKHNDDINTALESPAFQ